MVNTIHYSSSHTPNVLWQEKSGTISLEQLQSVLQHVISLRNCVCTISFDCYLQDSRMILERGFDQNENWSAFHESLPITKCHAMTLRHSHKMMSHRDYVIITFHGNWRQHYSMNNRLLILVSWSISVSSGEAPSLCPFGQGTRGLLWPIRDSTKSCWILSQHKKIWGILNPEISCCATMF